MADSWSVDLEDLDGDGREGSPVVGSGFEDQDSLVGGFYSNAAEVLEVRWVGSMGGQQEVDAVASTNLKHDCSAHALFAARVLRSPSNIGSVGDVSDDSCNFHRIPVKPVLLSPHLYPHL